MSKFSPNGRWWRVVRGPHSKRHLHNRHHRHHRHHYHHYHHYHHHHHRFKLGKQRMESNGGKNGTSTTSTAITTSGTTTCTGGSTIYMGSHRSACVFSNGEWWQPRTNTHWNWTDFARVAKRNERLDQRYERGVRWNGLVSHSVRIPGYGSQYSCNNCVWFCNEQCVGGGGGGTSIENLPIADCTVTR